MTKTPDAGTGKPFEPRNKNAESTLCQIPPKGWMCTRFAGHDGPCAAVPDTNNLVHVALQITDGDEAESLGVTTQGITVQASGEDVLISAFHYPTNDEGARVIADILRTAADGINTHLDAGRTTQVNAPLVGGEKIADTIAPERYEEKDREAADNTTPKRPRFNPKPRGSE